MKYVITLVIDEAIPDDIQADCQFERNTVVDVCADTGTGIVGRIVSVQMRRMEIPRRQAAGGDAS